MNVAWSSPGAGSLVATAQAQLRGVVCADVHGLAPSGGAPGSALGLGTPELPLEPRGITGEISP